MRLHSVFLRKGCRLPDRLDPLREPLENGWTQVVDLDAPVFDTMIRQAGWHFMQIRNFCTRMGFGISQKNAAERALVRALDGIAQRFNAAELESVQIAKYFGFHVATVSVRPRKIQQQTSLDGPSDI